MSNGLFLILAILVGMMWHLTMALTCISLQAKDIEHLFWHLLAMCMSSLEKCLFRFFTHLKNGLFVVSLLRARFPYIVPTLIPHQISDLQIFSPFYGLSVSTQSNSVDIEMGPKIYFNT